MLRKFMLLLFVLLAGQALAGCPANTHLGKRDLQRLSGRTYVVTGA